ncbi:MAG TPA: alpha/beta hydrolase-fold protein [Chryseolinea sp.]
MKVSLILICALLLACSEKNDVVSQGDESTKRFTHFSEIVRDTFVINVQVPHAYFENPDAHYRTAYVLDGNFYFPMMASILRQYEIAGLLEPTILVAIGYRSFKEMDSLRTRDYLYPAALKSDEMETVGGGERFYEFLTEELLPVIDGKYRTKQSERALLGHSFGGYFVLYSLMNQLKKKTSTFNKFVSASPTLWYNDFFIKDLPQHLKDNSHPLQIFISAGQREDSIWSVQPVKDLAGVVQKINPKHVELKSRIYSHLDHMDVALLSFTKGLQ